MSNHMDERSAFVIDSDMPVVAGRDIVITKIGNLDVNIQLNRLERLRLSTVIDTHTAVWPILLEWYER